MIGSRISRRDWIGRASLLGGAAAGWNAWPAWSDEPVRLPPVKLTPEGLRVHGEGFVFDGHNDLPWELREQGDPGFQRLDIAQSQPTLHTDLPRLKQGNVGAQFWSVYVPVETIRAGDALAKTLEQIDLVHRLVRRYPDALELARTFDDVLRIRAAGKIASLIGVEGGHSIQNSIGVLRQLHTLGARYMTLTHADTLDWADSATDDPRHGGLSPFGEEIVREMNRLGMLVDISHVSVETMHDALRVSRAPVIASHSSAFAVAPHPRNVPDDVLKLVAQNGGVIMLNFYSGFVDPQGARTMAQMFDVRRKLKAQWGDTPEYEKAMTLWRRENPIPRGSVRTVVDHLDHIVRVAGIAHVGLGSDFDGIAMTPEQLDDVACYPYITQEMLNRGYTSVQIHQVLSGNILRVLREAERVAQAG